MYDHMIEGMDQAPVLNVAGVSNLDGEDRLKKADRDVITSYTNIQGNTSDVQTQAILNNIDETILRRINKEIKTDNETKKKMLAIRRSMSIDTRGDDGNYSSIKIEDMPADVLNGGESPVYRFIDNSPRMKRR